MAEIFLRFSVIVCSEHVGLLHSSGERGRCEWKYSCPQLRFGGVSWMGALNTAYLWCSLCFSILKFFVVLRKGSYILVGLSLLIL